MQVTNYWKVEGSYFYSIVDGGTTYTTASDVKARFSELFPGSGVCFVIKATESDKIRYEEDYPADVL